MTDSRTAAAVLQTSGSLMVKRNTSLEDEQLENKIRLRDLLRLKKYIKPHKRLVFRVVAAAIIMSCCEAGLPYVTKIVIDDAVPQKDLALLSGVVALGIALIFVYALLNRYRILAVANIGQDMLKSIRRDLFEHIQSLSFDFFDSRPHGKILIRIVNYVNTLSDALSSGLVDVLSDIFLFFVTLIVIFAVNFRLALCSLAFFPLLVLWIYSVRYFQRAAYRNLSNKQSNVSAFVHESVSGIKTVKIFAQEKSQIAHYRRAADESRTAWMKTVRLNYLVWPGVQTIYTFTIAFIFYVGVMHYFGIDVSAGVLVAFTGYTKNFWSPVIRIGDFYNQLVTCSAYVERIFETMDEKPLIENAKNAEELETVRGDVDYDNVCFSYDSGTQILHNVNLHVKAGSTIAFVGPTGAGKTTVVSLLSRFYDVSSGSVRIDGTDVRDVKIDSLRRQIGVMLQDSFLFNGSIKDNIRYGRLDATDEEVEAAAKAVFAHDYIATLPDGYDTVVGERGTGLSAGQCQLISFARVLLSNPRILVLDEATSHVDTVTEAALQSGLRALLKGRTSFIIAHRLSTIEHADLICYIDKGRIVESGTHSQLLSSGGYYANLYESQFE